MAEYLIQEETLTGIGDKIRSLTGTEGVMTPTGMQTDLDTFNTDMGTVINAQDSLITQITIALNGKVGVSTTVGETTQSAAGTSITIPSLINKDNVVLMYVDSCDCPASQSENAGIVNVIIQENFNYHVIHYHDGLYSFDNDGFISYNKTTGTISLVDSYNERFIAGEYIYITW